MTISSMTTTFVIREAAPDDLPRLHAMNEAATPGVGSVTAEELAGLLARSWRTLVAAAAGADAPLGFLLSLRPGTGYQSPNYRWFEDRHRDRGDGFLYIDRIAVAAEARGARLGEALYRALIAAAAPGLPLCCEVNLQPPNPGSLRFHNRLGFAEVGRAAYEPGRKEVAFLERAAAPAGS